MFIDVQQKVLFWLVAAWEDDFTGYVVDYGTWPDQQRAYFTLRDIQPDAGRGHAGRRAGRLDLRRAGEALRRAAARASIAARTVPRCGSTAA